MEFLPPEIDDYAGQFTAAPSALLERIEREIKQRKEKAEADLMVVYSLRLTKAQRIKLLKLGGPQWLRNQIDRSS